MKDFCLRGANRIMVATNAVIFDVTQQILFLLADTSVLSTTMTVEIINQGIVGPLDSALSCPTRCHDHWGSLDGSVDTWPMVKCTKTFGNILQFYSYLRCAGSKRAFFSPGALHAASLNSRSSVPPGVWRHSALETHLQRRYINTLPGSRSET